MDIFLKAAAGVLITIIISMILSRQGKDYSVLLVICVCCMVIAAAIGYIQSIFDFMKTLEGIGNLNSGFITTILKAVGIGLLSEITVLICNDSGNSALGKVIQILSTAAILWLCIPLFTELTDLIQGILGNI